MKNILHLAIYETAEFSLMIEYQPLDAGAIEILHVDYQPRRVSHFEQRQQEKRARKLHNVSTMPYITDALEIAPSES